MALVNQTIPGLYNGVSQQPDELRLDTQVTEMINCYPTLVQGVQKRNPVESLVEDTSLTNDAFIHTYDRGAGDEQYIIAVKAGSYKVYDETGATVTDWTTNSYLNLPSGSIPRDSFAMVTVGDTTFVVNKTVTCAMDPTVDYNDDQYWDRNFYYWVKRTTEIRFGENNNSSKGYTYYIYNNNSQQTSQTNVDGVAVASSLASAIGGSSRGSVVKKTAANGTDIWSGADSWGNQASESWQGTAGKLADLPSDLGYQNAVIEIAGDDKSAFDNFFVKFKGSAYLETFKPGLQNTIDGSTMPHKLERLGNGSFAMSTIAWDDRKVGDEETAPEPSFIGRTLDDVFFFKNRLGVLAQDNVVMSETGEYYNFFPTTVTDVLDSDPIDVAVDSNKAVHLRYAVPYNKELLIFGDNAQFILSATKALSPKDVNIQQSTAFSFNKDVAPYVIGPNVYFVTEKASSSLVREYYTTPDSISNDAANITAHCPNYLPTGIKKITGSSRYDMLFALPGDGNVIYVYNFFWQGDEKAQSAWHKWELESTNTIFNFEVLNDDLLLFVDYGNGEVEIEKVSLQIPLDFSTIDYTDEDGTIIKSTIEFSKWGIPSGQSSNVDSNRSSLIIRDLRFSMDDDSYFGVTIDRNGVKRTYNNYVTSPSLALEGDNKFPVVGSADNLSITFSSEIAKGFKLNTMSWRGQLHLKGSRGI